MENGNLPIAYVQNIQVGFTEDHKPYYYSNPGLTKREYFAGLAMQGILACPNSSGKVDDIVNGSVELADALLKALTP